MPRGARGGSSATGRCTAATLSNLLWAAWGTNRPDGHRTAPSALNAQEIDLYVALPEGAYLYDHAAHALNLVAGQDVRRVTGYQDFVDKAPLDLVFVANHGRMRMVPAESRALFAADMLQAPSRRTSISSRRAPVCRP